MIMLQLCSLFFLHDLEFYLHKIVYYKESGLPLWQMDLSNILDKYIGESEKHLHQIFADANKQNAILLFDEADVLFGKRTEISSSNDRYANSSTAYLLQEMERYEGVVILTSNLIHNFDDAFLRRISFIVRFSLPQTNERKDKWMQAYLNITQKEELPYDLLAQHVEVSLAQIDKITEHSIGYWLSSEEPKLCYHHVFWALKQEYQKQQRTLPKALGQDFLHGEINAF